MEIKKILLNKKSRTKLAWGSIILLVLTILIVLMVNVNAGTTESADKNKTYDEALKLVTISDKATKDKLFEAKLIYNTYICGDVCEARISGYNYKKIILNDTYSSDVRITYYDSQLSEDIKSSLISEKVYVQKLESSKNKTTEKWELLYDNGILVSAYKNLDVGAFELWIVGNRNPNERRDIDWVPSFLGFEITEWATWTYVDVLFQYNFDEVPQNNVTLIDNYGRINSTIIGTFNRSIGYTGNSSDWALNTSTTTPNTYINVTLLNDSNYKTRSIDFWINCPAQGNTGGDWDEGGAMPVLFAEGYNFSAAGYGRAWYINGTNLDIATYGFGGGAYRHYASVVPNICDNVKHHITLVQNYWYVDANNNMWNDTFYKDAVQVYYYLQATTGGSGAQQFSIASPPTNLQQGSYLNASMLDKFTYFTIRLNTSDVLELNQINQINYDVTAPIINIVYPLNQTYNVNVSELNYNVYDANINSCWYSLNNGSTNTTITCGNNVTSLTSLEGTNIWKIWANDTSNNVNVSTIIFLKDTTAPYFITIPANASLTYGQTLGVDFDATDLNAFDNFAVNESKFSINKSGYLTNLSGLSAGGYVLNISINDTAGNTNFTIWQLDVSQIAPTLTYLLNHFADNFTGIFPQTINATSTTDAGTLVIYRNGEDRTADNGLNITNLGVYYYEFDFNVTGDANYTNIAKRLFANITINTTTTNLTVSPASPQGYGVLTNFSCLNSISIFNLTINSADKLSENSLSLNRTAGIYVINCSFDGNTNYTSTSNSTNFTLNKASSTIYTYIDNNRSNLTTTNSTSYWINGTILQKSTTGSINLTVNNITQLNYTDVSLDSINYYTFTASGVYIINTSYPGDTNYTSSSESWYVFVSNTATSSGGGGSPSTSRDIVIGNLSKVICDNVYTFITSNMDSLGHIFYDESKLINLSRAIYSQTGSQINSSILTWYIENFEKECKAKIPTSPIIKPKEIDSSNLMNEIYNDSEFYIDSKLDLPLISYINFNTYIFGFKWKVGMLSDSWKSLLKYVFALKYIDTENGYVQIVGIKTWGFVIMFYIGILILVITIISKRIRKHRLPVER